MKYRITILNSASFLFIAGCLLYTAKNYAVLSKEEGWGLMYPMVLLGFAVVALIADFVIQQVTQPGNRQIKTYVYHCCYSPVSFFCSCAVA